MDFVGSSDNFGKTLIWNKGYFEVMLLKFEFELYTMAEWVRQYILERMN